MFKSHSIKIGIGIIALAVIWFTVSPSLSRKNTSGERPISSVASQATSQTLVSAIQPIEQTVEAQAQSQNKALSGRLDIQTVNRDLQQRFTLASQQARQGNTQSSIQTYKTLILDYPDTPELYLNLAALYVQQQQLELARLTLNDGLNAKQEMAALYKALQVVHGALAGRAYQKALNQTPTSEPDVALEMALSLSAPASSPQFDQYQQQLTALQSQHQSEIVSYQNKIAIVEDQLQALQDEFTSLERVANNAQRQEQKLRNKSQRSQAEFEKLQVELTALKEQTNNQQQALAIAAREQAQAQRRLKEQQQAAREAQLLAQQKEFEIQQALKEQQAAVLAAEERARQQAEQQRATQIARQQAEQRRQADIAKQANIEQQQASQRKREAQGVALVRAWAQAWSAQDVPSYLSFYIDDYRPTGKNISHAQWRAQRQVRLTNKKFIDVKTSNYSIDDRGDQFIVTFSQHYRSDTLDDRIRKRLIFKKQGDDDWSNAKIISERVL